MKTLKYEEVSDFDRLKKIEDEMHDFSATSKSLKFKVNITIEELDEDYIEKSEEE